MGFGLFRFILANLVILHYLWPTLLRKPGGFAVFSFYLLSGFFITLVLNAKYYNKKGLYKFFYNRILRIYPEYFLAILLSLVVIYIAPKISSDSAARLFFPKNRNGPGLLHDTPKEYR